MHSELVRYQFRKLSLQNFTSLFHRSKFQKSRSLRDIDHFLKSIFDHFSSKIQTFLNIEKSFKIKIRYTTRKEDAEYAGVKTAGR